MSRSLKYAGIITFGTVPLKVATAQDTGQRQNHLDVVRILRFCLVCFAKNGELNKIMGLLN